MGITRDNLQKLNDKIIASQDAIDCDALSSQIERFEQLIFKLADDIDELKKP